VIRLQDDFLRESRDVVRAGWRLRTGSSATRPELSMRWL
jgi:hypothetical protein